MPVLRRLISLFNWSTIYLKYVFFINSIHQSISLSFGQVKGYVMKNWRTLTTPGQPMPAYIQLDHVYGLCGFDLNMSRVPPRGKRSVKHSLCSNPTPASAPTPAPRHMISLEGMGMGMSRCIDSEGMHASMITMGPWIKS